MIYVHKGLKLLKRKRKTHYSYQVKSVIKNKNFVKFSINLFYERKIKTYKYNICSFYFVKRCNKPI